MDEIRKAFLVFNNLGSELTFYFLGKGESENHFKIISVLVTAGWPKHVMEKNKFEI